ncbi:glucans biosynthesis glucosyltransferase MdoH [Amorphus sp. MBR-141]
MSVSPATAPRCRQIEVSRSIRMRRWAMAAAVTLTVALLLVLMVVTLSPAGIVAADIVMIALFAVTLPYTAVGFWNATIGLVLMRFAKDPMALACPAVAADDPAMPITDKTALLVCIRNEDVDLVVRNLDATLAGLVDSGTADRFDVYVLSDSSWLDIITAEERAIADLASRYGEKISVTYRRRTENTAYKSGNIRDFCDRWGAGYAYAVVLDADSYMSTAALHRLVRVMQANPGIGILQSLVVGLPTTSFFARLFQFGMRLGMRSHTLGAAWWQADCGPYWGHNAILRLAPFIEDCHMPVLPGRPPLGGWILSHDQVEAAFMRRAGYEVRVIPEEFGSFEENPPTLPEFVRRDLRWCQGNMQYGPLIGLPGLAFLSRVQLVLAMLMFLGSAAWIGLMVVTALRVTLAAEPVQIFRPDTGVALFVTIMAMVFAPKAASVLDVLSRSSARRSFGGTWRFLVSLVGEVVFFMLLAPVAALSHTLFLAGLPFGATIGWNSQRRSGHEVSFARALHRFWPQTLVGIAGVAAFAAVSATALYASLPIVAGLTLAVPIAVLTAAAAPGRLALRLGLWRIPEETLRPAALTPLRLDALAPHPAEPAGKLPVAAYSEAANG